MDSIPERVFDIWWSYYQCEPFGCHWEQTASLAATMSATSAMIAASRGVTTKPIGVLDFMPSDSVPWMKRERREGKKITSGAGQSAVIKQAFGFR